MKTTVAGVLAGRINQVRKHRLTRITTSPNAAPVLEGEARVSRS